MPCRVGVAEGEELLLYSFPPPHPFTRERALAFWNRLHAEALPTKKLGPQKADKGLLELFQTSDHIKYVELASHLGYGALDQGDTPAFKGVFEASQFAVGTTAFAAVEVVEGRIDHAFNPVGGLHHATKDSSAGFCVFNDIGITIELLRKSQGVRRILYVDIDVHHGDGVYYSYESDPEVFIFDIHQDGRYLYPGTGKASERGSGNAAGTKVNVPLMPGSGDQSLFEVLPRLEEFAKDSRPDFIIFQCGADGLRGDPIAGLSYSSEAHTRTAFLLHALSHQLCQGRLVALGGGGYVPRNCADAWVAVVKAML